MEVHIIHLLHSFNTQVVHHSEFFLYLTSNISMYLLFTSFLEPNIDWLMWKWGRVPWCILNTMHDELNCAWDGINFDTKIYHMCVLSRYDCQSNPCCLSLLWQVANYSAHHRLRPNHDIYLDKIIILPRATPLSLSVAWKNKAPEKKGSGGWGCEPRSESGGLQASCPVGLWCHLTQKAPFNLCNPAY